MVRPGRRQARWKRAVRRRHRTWMLSMTAASLGWGTVWLTVVLMKVAPGWAPGVTAAEWISSGFALAGLAIGVFTLRAKLAWILITAVPLFANGSLLVLPWIVPDPSVLFAR
ncbi:MAG: hypothetical protein H6828_16240 [Planctomycetes bacterium]|nr:hypothetical protein [Planctomycetota bacterium]